MIGLLRDLRFALRALLRSPGYAFVAILTLAGAIGANTAIFSAVNLVLLRPLPYHAPEEIVFMVETRPEFERLSVPYPNYLDYRAGQSSFAAVAAMSVAVKSLTGEGEPEKFLVETYTHEFLPLLGVSPSIGRNFLPEEDAPNAEKVILLSHGLWSRRFAADPEIVGRRITLDEELWTVVGVMPPGYRTFFPAAAYVPLGLRADDGEYRDRAVRPEIYMFGRLRPGVTVEQARADMGAIGEELGRRFPEAVGSSRPLLLPMREEMVHDFRVMLLLLLGAVGCVLLVATANVANLTLERAMKRQRELGIRAALGASRWQLVRPVLAESLLISAIGGGLGLLFALWGVDLITAYRPGHMVFNVLGPIEIDAAALLFTAAVALGVSLSIGLVPALLGSRQNLAQVLKDADNHASAGGRHLHARSVLIIIEVALAMMLTIGAGLAVRSLTVLHSVDPGFDPHDVMYSGLSMPERYKTKEEALQFWSEVERRMSAIPGVLSVTMSSGAPAMGASYETFYPDGAARTPADAYVAAVWRVEPGYIETLRIPLLAGRTCGAQDGPGAQPVVLIGQRLADKFFPGQDPVGKRLQDRLSKLPSVEIAGVVGDILADGPGRPERTPYQLIYCNRQLPASAQSDPTIGMAMFVLARTDGDPNTFASQIRAAVGEIDPVNPMWGIGTLDDVVQESLMPRRFTARLLAGFAAVALLLAAIGLYAVMATTVTRRTRELGVRMALGAQPGSVVALVVRQGMRVVAVGLAVGLVGGFALSHVLSSIRTDGVDATDPPTYVGVTALLAAVCLLAMYLPARRATRIDPMIALRHD